jgi:hypothetical protein
MIYCCLYFNFLPFLSSFNRIDLEQNALFLDYYYFTSPTEMD